MFWILMFNLHAYVPKKCPWCNCFAETLIITWSLQKRVALYDKFHQAAVVACHGTFEWFCQYAIRLYILHLLGLLRNIENVTYRGLKSTPYLSKKINSDKLFIFCRTIFFLSRKKFFKFFHQNAPKGAPSNAPENSTHFCLKQRSKKSILGRFTVKNP